VTNTLAYNSKKFYEISEPVWSASRIEETQVEAEADRPQDGEQAELGSHVQAPRLKF
jgi:hypothetical protein